MAQAAAEAGSIIQQNLSAVVIHQHPVDIECASAASGPLAGRVYHSSKFQKSSIFIHSNPVVVELCQRTSRAESITHRNPVLSQLCLSIIHLPGPRFAHCSLDPREGLRKGAPRKVPLTKSSRLRNPVVIEFSSPGLPRAILLSGSAASCRHRIRVPAGPAGPRPCRPTLSDYRPEFACPSASWAPGRRPSPSHHPAPSKSSLRHHRISSSHVSVCHTS